MTNINNKIMIKMFKIINILLILFFKSNLKLLSKLIILIVMIINLRIRISNKINQSFYKTKIKNH
jgi:hypothetical protein